jgi:mono/diheme cytochrome c family protein
MTYSSAQGWGEGSSTRCATISASSPHSPPRVFRGRVREGVRAAAQRPRSKSGARPGHLFLACASAALAICGCASDPRRDEPFTRPLDITDAKVALGQRVFFENCNACHANGAGAYGPSLNDKSLPAWYIKFRVRAGLGAMPPFDAQKINDPNLDALTLYLLDLRAL